MSTMIPPPPQQFVQPPKRKRFGWLALIIAVACSLAVGSCTGALARGGSGTAGVPAPTVTKTVTAKAAPAEKPAEEEKPTEPAEEPEEPAGLADGTYEVGVDVEPGRYKTVVPDDSFGCYWARLKDDSGEFEAIIANENGEPGSRMSVTIKKSDGFFESRNCGEWKRSD
ncbi:hypothetical protein [Microlunatus parietis]|uniref:Uncharacterized protein n=1 Tax=Microlunatus parietis TaxID=682979 RepID=A0A7Y9L9R4_9ACTN|nr:hypothetical protein [Microlunatus parietis]NYE68850.1 hypothetical protein [Microlunatus parietis]